ncbi:prolipoprotein diacylglyceryl transferase [Mycoplasma putrefaciens]|uniref:Prolipoprotein diacylglyceryl transferase-1 n=1 Tax=Mycoplasma putrefaciens (strain ATCC 15718 / NCTC 10155 / C30 KS-1 / KS-1) TaxID=743965 RepID=A0A7U4E9H6_MYCPK|nr:prolipoprotein diacylglyceryl transferase family protein [Mycoplasma putrefaciens]AEM68505.1 prolipoprotein diacylglyceryl transferase-1 [Mycoplasma putrefaciens KS1]
MNKTYYQWLLENGDPSKLRNLFGVVPAYPVFMFIGIILVIIACVVHLKLRGIPLKDFQTSIFLIIPMGILGATILGKMFLPFYQRSDTWYKIFFFWDPGMSLFGALLFGSLTGIGWFLKKSKTTQISLWVYADCIIPNILLGQMIGRWGNFYNHEILGQATSWDALWYLPSSIKTNLFYFPDFISFFNPSNSSDLLINHQGWWIVGSETYNLVKDFISQTYNNQTFEQVLNSPIQYHQPLFLFESFFNFWLWILITFIVSNLSRWFSKPKPWDLQPTAFPGWFNKKYKSLKKEEIQEIKTIVPIKYKKVIIETDQNKTVELKLSFYQAWNKAYYWYEPDINDLKIIEDKIIKYQYEKRLNDQQFKKIKLQHQNNLDKIRKNYQTQLLRLNKHSSQYKKILELQKQELLKEKQLFKQKQNNYYSTYTVWNKLFNVNPYATELEKLHNPNNYFVIRCGVTTGCFVAGYLIIRIILETMRRDTELFIQNARVLNFIVLTIILISGITIIIVAQFIAPYKWRKIGWLYEKSY